MKTKLTLFVAVLAFALFGAGCASSSLVAYYPFNANANDESGNGHDGEVNGATLSQDRNGKEKGAYSFSGEYIGVEYNKALRLRDSMTISVWINPRQFTPWQRIIMKANAAHKSGYGIALGDKNDVGFLIFDGNIKRAKLAKGIKLNQWQHVVAVRKNRDNYVIYFDGVSMPLTRELDNYEGAAGSRLIIGAQSETHDVHRFKGSIDDVRIYNRALSAEEVKALYDIEKPKGK